MPAAKTSSGRNIKVSKQAVDEAFKALSNWGRWGKDDQIGTLNHITPADVVAASKQAGYGIAACVQYPAVGIGAQTDAAAERARINRHGVIGRTRDPAHSRADFDRLARVEKALDRTAESRRDLAQAAADAADRLAPRAGDSRLVRATGFFSSYTAAAHGIGATP